MLDIAYPLKETHVIDDVEYDVDFSYDNILRIIDLMNDNALDDESQVEIALYMLLGFHLECDIYKKETILNEILEDILKDEAESSPTVDLDGNPMPVVEEKSDSNYDLKQDAPYIFASFMSDYGIDLFEQQGMLHWEKFKALLSGLTDDSKFMRVIDIRNMEIPSGKGTAKQAAAIKKMKKQYALKGDDTNEFEDDQM